MKNFFKKLFGKKYPDRANEPSTRHGRVYAGPGYFRSRTECVYAGPPREDDEAMLCVYAGPPEDLDPEVEDVVLEEVYNGPGMMDEIGWGSGEPDPAEEPDGEPDAEPTAEPDEEPAAESCETPDASENVSPENTETEAEPMSEDDPAAPEIVDEEDDLTAEDADPSANPNWFDPKMVAAYAGPAVQNVPIGFVYAGPNNMPNPAMQPNPNLLMTMMAYFGPGGPNGPAVMPGMMSAMMMQQPAQPVDPSVDLVRQEHKFCPNCGAVVPPTQKFCNECGTDLSNEPIQKGIAVDAGEETPSGTEE